MRRMGRLAIAATGLAGLLAMSVTAQTPAAPPVERVANILPGNAPRGESVRIVAPGALALASLDKDHDGRITDIEISAGAPALFARADRNADKQLSAFEQGDWATSMGAGSDVLSNPMLFDVDLDRAVTEPEFRAGLLRVAEGLKAANADAVTYNDLVRPLNARQRAEDAASADGVDRVDGPPPGGRPGR
jgi:hypothetical protein